MREHFDVFLEITARWHLTQSERRALLASPTDERWVQFIYGSPPDSAPAELARVQSIIEIDAALSNCVNEPLRSQESPDPLATLRL
jgi:hypothetical protein